MPNATISQLQFEDNGALIDIKPFIDYIYPIGAIYFSATLIDPSIIFGGEWEQISGKFLFAADETHEVGSTGGSATMAHTHQQVTTTSGGPSNNTSGGPSNNTSGGPSNNTSGSTAITVSQMPSHKHNVSYRTKVVPKGDSTLYYFDAGTAGTWIDSPSFAATGGNGGHTHTLSSHTHGLSSHTHSLQSHTHSTSATTTGGASNDDNMPPYLTVYVWKRIA